MISKKVKILSDDDRIKNGIIGGSLGLLTGGAFIATAGAVMVVGGIKIVGSQIWAIGSLAFDLVTMTIGPVIGIELEPIEVEP